MKSYGEYVKKVGRPRKFDSPEQFDAAVDEYFDLMGEFGKPVTISGLALHMGFCDRASFYDYRKYPEFSNSVKRAHMLVEASYEERLETNKPTGPIFALKNMGWHDTQRTELSGRDGAAIELTDTDRAARIAALVAEAKKRKEQEAQGESDDPTDLI